MFLSVYFCPFREARLKSSFLFLYACPEHMFVIECAYGATKTVGGSSFAKMSIKKATAPTKVELNNTLVCFDVCSEA